MKVPTWFLATILFSKQFLKEWLNQDSNIVSGSQQSFETYLIC
jgi:hypothetical protein